MKHLPTFIKETQAVIRTFNKANGGLLARAIAFNLIVTAVPFIVIFIWAGSEFLKDSTSMQRMLTDQIKGLLPPDAAALLVRQITRGAQSIDMKGLGITGIVALFWLPLSLFSSIQIALGKVSGNTEVRPFFVRQLAGVLIQILLIELVFGFSFLALAGRSVVGFAGDFEILHILVTHVLSTVLVFVALTAIYRLSCRGVILKEAARAAMVVALLWQVLNKAGSGIVSASGNYDLIYGILAGVVVLLTYSYFFSVMLLFGGIVAVRRSGRRSSRTKKLAKTAGR